MVYPSIIYHKPELYELLTCPVRLWDEMLAGNSELGVKYQKLRRKHVDELKDILEFKEFEHANYIFARAMQDITLKTFGRNNSDWISIPKMFPYLNGYNIRKSFDDGSKSGVILLALTTFKKIKKSSFLSLFVPYKNSNIYVQLTKNYPKLTDDATTTDGTTVFSTHDRYTLEHICNSQELKPISDYEIAIVKHHLKKLELVLNS